MRVGDKVSSIMKKQKRHLKQWPLIYWKPGKMFCSWEIFLFGDWLSLLRYLWFITSSLVSCTIFKCITICNGDDEDWHSRTSWNERNQAFIFDSNVGVRIYLSDWSLWILIIMIFRLEVVPSWLACTYSLVFSSTNTNKYILYFLLSSLDASIVGNDRYICREYMILYTLTSMTSSDDNIMQTRQFTNKT